MIERQIEPLKLRQRVEQGVGQRVKRVAHLWIVAREVGVFSGLGARSEEQPSQPAKLAQCRQQLAIKHRKLQPAKVEFFRPGGTACRDAPQRLCPPPCLVCDHARAPYQFSQ